MINLNELKKEFDELDCKLWIIPYTENSLLLSIGNMAVAVTQDWIDYLNIRFI